MGAKILLSEQKVVLHEAQGDLLRTCPMAQLHKFRQRLCRVLPRVRPGIQVHREIHLLQQRDEKCKNLPEHVKLTQTLPGDRLRKQFQYS